MCCRFLFVHGTGHGAWCWKFLVEALSKRGLSCHAVDLPGCGNDSTDPSTVTMEMWVSKINDAVDSFASNDKIILVGHSSGGFPISAFAEIYSTKVKRLVYLCAYLPRNGESIECLNSQRIASFALARPWGKALQVSADGVTTSFVNTECVQFLYQDCTPEMVEYALEHLRPYPMHLRKVELSLSDERVWFCSSILYSVFSRPNYITSGTGTHGKKLFDRPGYLPNR